MIINSSNLQKLGISTHKLLIGLVSIIILGTTVAPPTSVYAGSNNDEVSCFERGLIDGEDHPFSQSTNAKCGDDYYQGFLQGCTSVDGNSRDICESVTDG
ncbi:hypothetical protein [Candidatus Nitrosocosmicus arcticus]|nr:hypothetical protein [Candidatus Nitrosocosmicus arcticus]